MPPSDRNSVRSPSRDPFPPALSRRRARRAFGAQEGARFRCEGWGGVGGGSGGAGRYTPAPAYKVQAYVQYNAYTYAYTSSWRGIADTRATSDICFKRLNLNSSPNPIATGLVALMPALSDAGMISEDLPQAFASPPLWPVLSPSPFPSLSPFPSSSPSSSSRGQKNDPLPDGFSLGGLMASGPPVLGSWCGNSSGLPATGSMSRSNISRSFAVGMRGWGGVGAGGDGVGLGGAGWTCTSWSYYRPCKA